MKIRLHSSRALRSGSGDGAKDTGRRQVREVVLAILLLALALRLWGISFGLPYDFTPDEVHEIVRALKLGAGEYSWTGGKGGLYQILFVEYGFLFLVWWLSGEVRGATDFALKFVQDPSAFYLLGRVTVALMGMLTCLVVYAVGRRIYGWQVGLAAALIGATAYYHAMWSHYINVDTGMTLAIWTGLLAYLTYEENGKARWLLLAGVMAGTAVSFKLPGGIVLPILLLAIATSSSVWSEMRRKIKEAGMLVGAMIVTIAVTSPESFLALFRLTSNFTQLFISEAAAAQADSYEWGDIYQITVLDGGGYLGILFRDYNAMLTVAALTGIAIGIWRQSRWDIIWTVSIVSFLLIMSAADRAGMERYLMPLIPAFWLLAASAVVSMSRGRPAVVALALIAIIGPSLFALVEQNYTWTRPDSRVLAKAWIEENVAPDSKILMDGMQYRFIQSPPLTPNATAVARRVEGVMDKDGSVSRGVSDRSLSLYARAMEELPGPKYDLHSTVWGLAVRDLDDYQEACFDYIITSSSISRRFERESYGERYPASVRFYRDLPGDSRFEPVYAVEPVRWRIQGPAITVYRVNSSCG